MQVQSSARAGDVLARIRTSTKSNYRDTAMTESSTELKLVKLLIVMQVHLELLDELQTTPIYRQNIKRSVNNLSKDLELQLNMLYKNMKTDNDVEEAYNAVKHGVDLLLSADTDTLYNIGYRPTNN
jgi:hypothetical protein